MRSEINQREWSRVRCWQMGGEVQTQAMINRGDNFGGIYRALDRIRADFVAFSNNPPSLHAASGKLTRPALRPVISSAGRIYLRCSTKFSQVANERIVQHPALK